MLCLIVPLQLINEVLPLQLSSLSSHPSGARYKSNQKRNAGKYSAVSQEHINLFYWEIKKLLRKFSKLYLNLWVAESRSNSCYSTYHHPLVIVGTALLVIWQAAICLKQSLAIGAQIICYTFGKGWYAIAIAITASLQWWPCTPYFGTEVTSKYI